MVVASMAIAVEARRRPVASAVSINRRALKIPGVADRDEAEEGRTGDGAPGDDGELTPRDPLHEHSRCAVFVRPSRHQPKLVMRGRSVLGIRWSAFS